MDPVSGAVAAIVALLKFIDALISEPIFRYFFLVACFFVNNVIGVFTGKDIIGGLISFAIAKAFNAEGFYFPTYYGVQSLFILVITYPLIFYLISHR